MGRLPLSITNLPANADISTLVDNSTPSSQKHIGDSNRALNLGTDNKVSRNIVGQFSNYFSGSGDPVDPIAEAVMSIQQMSSLKSFRLTE